jgi:hypothetical protein
VDFTERSGSPKRRESLLQASFHRDFEDLFPETNVRGLAKINVTLYDGCGS